MLKTVSSPKRDFDCFSNPHCSPHTISFLDSEARSAKRIRTASYQPESINEKDHKMLGANGLPEVWGTNWGVHGKDGIRVFLTFTAIDENKFLEWVPKKSRGRYQRASSRKEPVFSTEDVQQILLKAIEETKEILKKQYDQVLQERFTFLVLHF